MNDELLLQLFNQSLVNLMVFGRFEFGSPRPPYTYDVWVDRAWRRAVSLLTLDYAHA